MNKRQFFSCIMILLAIAGCKNSMTEQKLMILDVEGLHPVAENRIWLSH